MYPTWVTTTTGNLPQKTSSTKLTFNPSTGRLTSTSFAGDGSALTGIVAGPTITDDTTTNATRYVLFDDVTSGSLTAVNVSSTKLTYNPSTGALTAVSMVSSSDERLKENWRDLPINFVEKLASVKTGIYDRTDVNATQVGVSAQSLQTILPNAVIADAEGMLAVSYGNAALVATVELAKMVLELKQEIALLKGNK